MKIILPIRPTETEIEFSDFNKFKQDIQEFSLKNELLELLNYETKAILDIGFNITDKTKLFKNKTYKSLFENENERHLEDDFIIINLKTIYKELGNEDFRFTYEFLTEGTLYGFSLLINLSYEMALDFMRGFIMSDKDEYLGKTDIIFSHLDFAYDSIKKIKWPYAESVSLETTVKWFKKHQIVLNSVSNSKASRAINALSQMFGKITEPNSSFLFWSVLGIESLLAEGTNNISNQIKSKSILLFGEPKEFKKKINQLYNYRSRFVHGDIDFPPKFFYYDEKFEQEYWEYLNFSISLLIALIRKLIREDKTEFKFKYKYCG